MATSWRVNYWLSHYWNMRWVACDELHLNFLEFVRVQPCRKPLPNIQVWCLRLQPTWYHCVGAIWRLTTSLRGQSWFTHECNSGNRVLFQVLLWVYAGREEEDSVPPTVLGKTTIGGDWESKVTIKRSAVKGYTRDENCGSYTPIGDGTPLLLRSLLLVATEH